MFKRLTTIFVLIGALATISHAQIPGWTVSSTFASASADIINRPPAQDNETGTSFADAEEKTGSERGYGVGQFIAGSPIGTYLHSHSSSTSSGDTYKVKGYGSQNVNFIPNGLDNNLTDKMEGTVVVNKALDQKKALSTHGFGWWALDVKYDWSVNKDKFLLTLWGPNSNNDQVIIYQGYVNPTHTSATEIKFNYSWTNSINSTDWIVKHNGLADLSVYSTSSCDIDQDAKKSWVSNNDWLSE